MNYFFKLEWIGYNYSLDLKDFLKTKQDIPIKKYCNLLALNKKPWVSELKGILCNGEYRKEVIDADIDFTESTSTGSRNIYLMYILKDGGIYEVFENKSFRKNRKFFCTIVNGDLEEISEEGVCRILNQRNIKE